MVECNRCGKAAVGLVMRHNKLPLALCHGCGVNATNEAAERGEQPLIVEELPKLPVVEPKVVTKKAA